MLPLKISVAMCTYNGARYLPAQLQSIAAQIRQPDELVICDDKSGDATVSIAQDFARSVSFPVRITSNPGNIGSTKNFEQAIGTCSGSVITLCDQDDVWLPGKLAAIASVFEQQEKIDLVFSDATVVDDDLNPLGYSLWKAIRFTSPEQRMVRNNLAFGMLLRHNTVTGATMAFRSNWRSLVLPIPEWDVHDSWIALLIAAAGNVHLINEPLILYRQHEANQIGGRRRGLAYRLQRPRGAASRETKRVLLETEAIIARLGESGPSTTRHRHIAALTAKLRHLVVRDHYSARAPDSFLPFLGEILNGRYQRYSIGWSSVLHDLYKRLWDNREAP